METIGHKSCGVILLALVACLHPGKALGETGEATRSKPLSITLEGPATVPVRVTLAADPKAGKPVPATLWFDVYRDGKGVKRLKLPPGRQATIPLEVPEGTHEFEFRVGDPAAASASFTWTVPGAPAPATPASTNPESKAKPERSTTAAAPGGGRSGFAWEAGLLVYTRFSAKRYEPAAPGFFAAGWWPMGETVSVGGSIGLRRMYGERTVADYKGRVLPPYVVDVEAVPIEARVRWSRPSSGTALHIEAGAGLEYARSSYENAADVPRLTVENDWAPTASFAAGLTRPMAGGRLGGSAGVRFARHAFAAHQFELLHGIELTVGYARGF